MTARDRGFEAGKADASHWIDVIVRTAEDLEGDPDFADTNVMQEADNHIRGILISRKVEADDAGGRDGRYYAGYYDGVLFGMARTLAEHDPSGAAAFRQTNKEAEAMLRREREESLDGE